MANAFKTYLDYKIARDVCDTLGCDYTTCKYSLENCPKQKAVNEMCDILCDFIEEDNE